MEFLVVRAVELLRERGVEELSLNFAAFARCARPARTARARARPRVLGSVTALPDREPAPLQREVLPALGAAVPPLRRLRYLPRAGLAALRAEGQLPRLPTIGARPGTLPKAIAPAEPDSRSRLPLRQAGGDRRLARRLHGHPGDGIIRALTVCDLGDVSEEAVLIVRAVVTAKLDHVPRGNGPRHGNRRVCANVARAAAVPRY